MAAPPQMQPMFVSSSYRITRLHYIDGCATLSACYVFQLYIHNHGLHCTYGCPKLIVAYVFQLQLGNHYVTILLWFCHFKARLSLYRKTRLHQSYGCATISAAYVCRQHHAYADAASSAAYVCYHYLRNQWVTLHLQVCDLQNHWVTLNCWVCNIKSGLCLLALPSESLSYTTVMGAPSKVQSLFVSSSKRISGSHNTDICRTLSAAYIWQLQLQNYWVTPHLSVPFP